MKPQQFQLFETIPTDSSAKRRIRQEKAKQAHGVEQILSQMRNLREQLNDRLYTTAGERPAINSPADAAALVEYDLSPLDHEELHILILDRRNKVLKIVRLYVGSVNSSQVRVGEVFRDAIQLNASAIIPTHNHPSGDPTPSPDDVAVTRAMVQAGKLLDIEVLDHLVIGAGRWCSLKERGLGFA